jgi:hypothetical protein
LRRDGDGIDTLSVEISDVGSARKLLELLDRADADNLFKIRADPERDWGTPVSISRDVPVTCVLQPLTESTVTDALWYPAAISSATTISE